MTSRSRFVGLRSRAIAHTTRVVLAVSMVSSTAQAAEPVATQDIAASTSRPLDNPGLGVQTQPVPEVEITPAAPIPSPEAGTPSPEPGAEVGGIAPEPDDEGIPPEPDDEGIPPEPDAGAGLEPSPDVSYGPAEDGYNPVVDSPEAIRAKHWRDAGIVLLVVGTVLTGGGIAMAASDPCFLPAGNGCQVGGRNRAAMTMAIPGSVMLLSGAAALAYGIVAKHRVLAQFEANRRGFNVGLSFNF